MFNWVLGILEKSEKLWEEQKGREWRNLEKLKRTNSKYIAASGAVDATENAFISDWNIINVELQI